MLLDQQLFHSANVDNGSAEASGARIINIGCKGIRAQGLTLRPDEFFRSLLGVLEPVEPLAVAEVVRAAVGALSPVAEPVTVAQGS